MNLSYKKCSLSQFNLLVNIARQTFKDAFKDQNKEDDFTSYMEDAFSDRVFKEQLNNKKIHYYLISLKSEPIGYFKLNEPVVQSDLNTADSVELERIYVLKEYQGKGIGRRAIHRIIKIGKEMNYVFLWLGVWEHNPGAIKFYENLGFKKFGEHPYKLGNDIQTDWFMKLKL